MKKVLLALALFLGLANSLFAISINDIDLGTHPRAYITQIDIKDSNEILTKLNGVTYQYWNSVYPLNSQKYDGNIGSWVYTFDYQNFYSYDPIFVNFLDQADLISTYIYVQYPSSGYNSLKLQRGPAGDEVINPTGFPINLGNNSWVYKDENSNNQNYYEMITTIIPDEGGTVDLYAITSFNRSAL